MRKSELEVVSCESTGADGHRAILRPVHPADGDPTAEDIRSLGEPMVVLTNVTAEGVKALQPGTRFNVQLTQAKASATETTGAAVADAEPAKATASK